MSINLALASIKATGSTTSRSLGERFGELFNVKDFGAVGDGVTDDTIPIQNAANAAMAGEGGLKFPLGIYHIISSVTFNDADGMTSLHIEGEGDGAEIEGNFNDYLFKRLGQGTNELTSGVREVSNLKFRNGHATGGGLMWGANIGAHVHDCTFDANIGLNMEFEQSSLVTSCTFSRGQGAASAVGSIGISCGETTSIIACDISGFSVGVQFFGVGCFVSGCRFEVNDIAILPGKSIRVGDDEYADGYCILGGSFESNGIAIDCSQIGTGDALIGGFKIIGFQGAAPWPYGTSVASTTITGATSSATGTGVITTSGVLTLTSVTGTFQPGSPGERITGTNVPAGTFLYDQLTGSAGGAGTYNVRGTPRYGIKIGSDKLQNALFFGISANPQAYNQSILVSNTTNRNGLVFAGVSASNASTLGGTAWSIPTSAHTAEFINCNTAPTYTFANLPSGGNLREGDTYYITDGNQATVGNTVTAGGGANRSYVTYDGTNWRRGV